MKTYEIIKHLNKGETDYDGDVMTEDRYIVVDDSGYDMTGEHMSLKEAQKMQEYLTAAEIDNEIAEASKKCSHKWYWHLNALFPGNVQKQKEVEEFLRAGKSKSYKYGPVDFRGQIYYAVSRDYTK